MRYISVEEIDPSIWEQDEHATAISPRFHHPATVTDLLSTFPQEEITEPGLFDNPRDVVVMVGLPGSLPSYFLAERSPVEPTELDTAMQAEGYVPTAPRPGIRQAVRRAEANCEACAGPALTLATYVSMYPDEGGRAFTVCDACQHVHEL